MENTALTQVDLLTEDENPFFQYNKASQGQRFLNFLIDNVVIRIALAYVTGVAVGYLLTLISPEFYYSLTYNKSRLYLISVFIVLIDYILYYSLFEGIFKGRTVGKFITGTKAINENGIELTFKNAFLRSACRLIPFEAFSGFGTPWHDSITNTMVIKSR
jgi:uncharacterized RDD family membrane protein YckC